MSTDKKMFVKPGKANVRDPGRGYNHVPEYGAPVPRNNYWLRRLRDKAVSEITKDEFEKAKAAAEKAAAKKAAADQAKAKTKNEDK